MGTPEQDLDLYLREQDRLEAVGMAVEKMVDAEWAEGAHVRISVKSYHKHRPVWQWSLYDADGDEIHIGDGDYDSIGSAARDAEAHADKILCNIAESQIDNQDEY